MNKRTQTISICGALSVLTLIVFQATHKNNAPIESEKKSYRSINLSKTFNRNAQTEAVDNGSIPILADFDENDLQALMYQGEESERARGYITENELITYRTYSDQALVDLGQNGDLAALLVLANKFTKAGLREEASKLDHWAVIHGSTYALRRIAYGKHASIWIDQLEGDTAHHRIKEALAYLEVAALRGDRQGIIGFLPILNRENIVLSGKDLQDISDDAAKNYKTLVLARTRAALPPFNNLENTFTALSADIALLNTPNLNGWAVEYMTAKNIQPL